MVFRKHTHSLEQTRPAQREVWGAVTRAAAGGADNGDAYVFHHDQDLRLIAVIDGLGHGMGAREAAERAIGSIERHASEPLESILRATHEALRSTRGAVAGLARINCSTREVEYAGIGNTDFRALGAGGTVRFISLNGTLGSRLERVRVFKEQLPKVTTLVLSTDGISERWDAEGYPGLLGLHPELMCAVIMRDYSRPNDDATIICGRFSF
jgi:hypothetical protein